MVLRKLLFCLYRRPPPFQRPIYRPDNFMFIYNIYTLNKYIYIYMCVCVCVCVCERCVKGVCVCVKDVLTFCT